MTIAFAGEEVAGRKLGLFNAGSTDDCLHMFNTDGCNMMRPMPFSGYPFQGKILVFDISKIHI